MQDSIASVSTLNMQFRKPQRTLVAMLRDLPISNFPNVLMVRSCATGREVEFRFDTAAAEKAEFWDGEQAHYYSLEPSLNADYLVIVKG